MPELPEVETSRRGIAPWVENQQVCGVIIRERRLRWPIPGDIDQKLPGQVIQTIRRRAKYLLFETGAGTVMLHLGMSGSLRIIDADEPAGKHDHVDIQFDNGKALRFRDPRRFGSLLWTHRPLEHDLLRSLGPEPLSGDFDGSYSGDPPAGFYDFLRYLWVADGSKGWAEFGRPTYTTRETWASFIAARRMRARL